MFGTLYARQMFSVPGLGPNVYNLGIIFGAVFLSSFFTPGVIGMSWGATAGAIIGNLVIPILALRKLGAHFTISFDVSHPGVKKVFKLMLPVVLGLSLPGVFGLIMQAFGSFYPAGTNTVLEYSNKLMQAPLGIFGQSLAIAVFPALTQFFAQGQMDKFRLQLDSTIRQVIYLTVPVSVLMAVMAPQLVAAMYLHGRFTPEAARQTAVCLQLFAVGIWAWCLHPVLMRAFYSVQDTITPIVVGTITTFLFVGGLLLLKTTPLGYQALPLASSLAAMVLVVMMAIFVAKKTGGLDIVGIGLTVVKSLVGSLGVAIVAGSIAFTPIGDYIWRKKFETLGVTAVGLVVAMWVYFLITKAIGMPESGYVTRAIAKVSKKYGKAPIEENQ